MQPTLYVFRLREHGGLVITTDQAGSRLPIDLELDYKPGDWKFLEAIAAVDLPDMLFNDRDIEPAITRSGYFSVDRQYVKREHSFFKRHAD